MEPRARRVYDRNYAERNGGLAELIRTVRAKLQPAAAGGHIRSPQRKLWVNDAVTVTRARVAGGHISSPQRKLWVYGANRAKLAKRAT
jgi:hypothetical protein